jgi:cell division protein FtsI (penicillin-binding protein 3)
MNVDEKNKLWSLGEKGVTTELFQRRVYPHGQLYSHVLGQIDDDNYGISGIEYYFDRELLDRQKAKAPLILSLDSNIQFLIKTQLEKALEDFQANSAGGLLMDVNSGEVLSLVSLPDYNLNTRKNISDVKYMNKITKGVFELGSVFKTFTVALALEENILSPETIINNIPDNIKCSVHNISDIHDFPKSLSVEDILIRSSNIGSLMIARQIGKTKFKKFIEELGLLKVVNFELEEVGQPHNFKWEKCKLETVSFGHGITTTPLQAAAAYASITNGGYIIKPTLQLRKNSDFKNRNSIISNKTSDQINKILRKVVTEKKGTASNANIFGYKVGGKTGTAKNYKNSKKNINTFISIFPSNEPKYVLLVILDDPKGAPHIIYNYKGKPTTNISRTEAGWNSVYVSGKIIEKIGPILAINNNEVHDTHVVKKNN